MHARACVFLDRLGHETGRHPEPPRRLAHDPLQPHQVVCGLHHVGAIVQRQLILARRIFGNHRLGGDAGLGGTGINLGEQRLHTVQMVHRIDLGLVGPPPVQHRRRRTHPAIGVAVIGQQEELQLERRRGKQPFGRHRIDLTLQGMARVGCHGLTVERILGQEHLAPRRVGAMQRHQCSGDRPGPNVAIALIPDQAGFMHVLAADIQTKDRDRHMPPALVDRQQFVATDDLAAPDAVAVMQHNVKGLDLGVGGQKGLGLGHGRARWARVCIHCIISAVMSPKAAISRSIWSKPVAGLTSIMLWKGAIRQPRLTSAA